MESAMTDKNQRDESRFIYKFETAGEGNSSTPGAQTPGEEATAPNTDGMPEGGVFDQPPGEGQDFGY
jgi:hypothetical protein